MSKLRSVSTGFWSDPFIEDLDPSEKLLFLYLITNEKTNMLGIYESSVKKISFETGLDKETVQNGLKGFESLGKVKYQNNYVILINYMKHQNFNTNMKKSAIDIYNGLPNELKDSTITVSKDNPLKGFERLLDHFGMVSKVEVEYEVEEEKEVEVKEEDKYYYEYDSKFKLTNKELVKLKETYTITDIDVCIGNFERYIQSPDKYSKYKSMYRTIANWLKKDFSTPKENPKEVKPYNNFADDC